MRARHPGTLHPIGQVSRERSYRPIRKIEILMSIILRGPSHRRRRRRSSIATAFWCRPPHATTLTQLMLVAVRVQYLCSPIPMHAAIGKVTICPAVSRVYTHIGHVGIYVRLLRARSRMCYYNVHHQVVLVVLFGAQNKSYLLQFDLEHTLRANIRMRPGHTVWCG